MDSAGPLETEFSAKERGKRKGRSQPASIQGGRFGYATLCPIAPSLPRFLMPSAILGLSQMLHRDRLAARLMIHDVPGRGER
jgi:hypothetical protein